VGGTLSYSRVEGGSNGKKVLNAASKLHEAKTLVDAANQKAERLLEKRELARLQVDEHEKSVERQIGVVMAAIAEDRAARALSTWSSIVHEPIGPRLARLNQLLICEAASHDCNFPSSYRSVRDAFVRFGEALASDPDAQLLE
jgi:hypothetical protein